MNIFKLLFHTGNDEAKHSEEMPNFNRYYTYDDLKNDYYYSIGGGFWDIVDITNKPGLISKIWTDYIMPTKEFGFLITKHGLTIAFNHPRGVHHVWFDGDYLMHFTNMKSGKRYEIRNIAKFTKACPEFANWLIEKFNKAHKLYNEDFNL